MPKTRYNFTIDEDVLEMAKALAKQDNRSVSNLLEHLVKQAYQKSPPKTLLEEGEEL